MQMIQEMKLLEDTMPVFYLTDYILNNRSNDNVVVLGDFNNVGSQSII